MNENVTVCITPKGEKPVLHFSQFDNERVFTVTVLADDGESAAVLTGLDIEFRIRKTDSHVVTIAPESVADNVITFKTTEQLCACCGQNIASVVLMKDDMIVSTLDILVDIQRDILSGGLTSESDIRNLTTQIEQIVPEVVGDDYYNKQEVDEKIAEIPTFDPSNYYDKTYINTMYWTAQQIDQLFYRKTYINDNYYTKDDVYTKSDVYNKIETDNLLSAKMDSIGYHGVVDDAAVISFNTDSEAPLAIIKGKIDPNPGGVSTLTVTRTGKNIFNDTTGPHTINANTDVTLTIGNVYLKANTTYTISCKQTPAPLTSFVRNTLSVFGNGTTTYNPAGNDYTIKPMVFTPTVSGIYSIRVWGHTLSDTTTYSDFQVEINNQATEFEAYNGQTKTVNIGPSVTIGGDVDLTNGKITLSDDTEITITPVTVSSIAGVNNIFIDTGNLTQIAYFDGVDDHLNKLFKAYQIL